MTITSRKINEKGVLRARTLPFCCEVFGRQKGRSAVRSKEAGEAAEAEP
jgi:hypothetical protein